MTKLKLVAKAALFNDKGEVLLLRRSRTDKVRPGELDFPGGAVEEDETYHNAVLREISEEVGLTLDPGNVTLAYSATTYYDGLSTIRFLYVGKLSDPPQIRLSYEHDAYYWMSVEKVLEEFSHPVWTKGLGYLSQNDLLADYLHSID
ncbi:MAG TPA: NUDIX hydrolase [Patescibacteria group bacterium]|nr:NUDIX hydrolase [Patescibacteria group bacterium]